MQFAQTSVNEPATLQTRHFDFDGASGPLDFDTQIGEAPADISVFCVGRPDGKTASFVDSGRYYSAASGAMTGTYACK